jgi:hypothetical protein
MKTTSQTCLRRRKSLHMQTWMASLLVSIGILGAAHGQSLQLPKLRPPHGELGPTFWEQHHWAVIISSAAFLVLAPLLVLWLLRPKPRVFVPPEVIARRALEALRGRTEDGPLTVEVSRILRNYLISVFMLPLEEFTTAEMLQALQARPQADPALVKSIGAFLRRCDELKFGPTFPPAQTGLVAQASDLVEEIEKQRPRTLAGATAQSPDNIPASTAA